jgi:hypothetical protein
MGKGRRASYNTRLFPTLTSCHTQMGALQQACDAQGNEVDVEHMLLKFFSRVVSHGFKSIVACVLVGEVRLNFYTVLDKAS